VRDAGIVAEMSKRSVPRCRAPGDTLSTKSSKQPPGAGVSCKAHGLLPDVVHQATTFLQIRHDWVGRVEIKMKGNIQVQSKVALIRVAVALGRNTVLSLAKRGIDSIFTKLHFLDTDAASSSARFVFGTSQRRQRQFSRRGDG